MEKCNLNFNLNLAFTNFMCVMPILTLNPNLSFSFSNSNNLHTYFCPSPLYRSSRGSSSSSGIRASAADGNKDYYASLNVNRNATLKDIKSSYRKLARQFHPDMNKSPGAEDKFKEISAAYEVLSDEEKRSLYDRYGEPGLQEEYGGSGFGSHGVDPFEVFGSYFGESNSFFGGSDFRNNRSQSLDIRCDLSLSFKESIFGGQKNIEVSFSETCDNCNGSGAKSSSCIKTCVDCGGKGGVMKSQKTPFGVMSQVSTCSKCGGEGKVITDYCKKCDGRGKVQSQRSIEVLIPPGVNDGATMKVQGEGSLDKQRGIAGDLYLFVHIEEKQGIRREGVNLYSNITIDYTEAILGTTIKVETVEGLRDVYISAGTQPGDMIKLPSMGVPHFKKSHIRGDHYFIVNVVIPKEISDSERTLVKKLASVRASSRIGATPSNGTSESQKTVNADNRSSLWGSIKNIFGGEKKSDARFASISVGALNHHPIPASDRSRGGNVSVVVSVCMILLTVFVRSLAGRKRTELSKLQILHPDTKKRKDSY